SPVVLTGKAQYKDEMRRIMDRQLLDTMVRQYSDNPRLVALWNLYQASMVAPLAAIKAANEAQTTATLELDLTAPVAYYNLLQSIYASMQEQRATTPASS